MATPFLSFDHLIFMRVQNPGIVIPGRCTDAFPDATCTLACKGAPIPVFYTLATHPPVLAVFDLDYGKT
ncbi:MAG: hypothetical protein P8010_12995, partial [Desulfosarcinaceae bacterium]